MPEANNFCSFCGSELTSSDSGELQKRVVLRTYFRDFIFDLLIPFLVGIKTTWLILAKPTEFGRAIFFREKPADELSFPLTRFWKRISDAPQYVFQPGQYWFFVLAFMAVVQILLRDGGVLQMGSDSVTSDGGAEFASGNLFFLAIRPIINTLVDDYGISSDLLELPFELLYIIFIFFSTAFLAFLYHQFIGKDKLPSNHNFTFWLYLVGAMSIGARLVLLLFAIIGRPNSAVDVSFLRNLMAIAIVPIGLGYFLFIFPLFMPTVAVSRIFDSIGLKKAAIATVGTYVVYGLVMGLLYGLVRLIL